MFKPGNGSWSCQSVGALAAWLALVLLFSSSPAIGQFGASEHYFAHFGRGGGALTEFTLHNPGTDPVEVTVEVFRSSGALLVSRVVSVAPGATQTTRFAGGDAPVAGWARLKATRAFAATEFFATPIGNVGVLPGIPASRLRVFSYRAGQTRTGFAVANPNGSAANLTLRILAANGASLGEVAMNLPAFGHSSFFLDEAPISMTTSGTLEVVSDQPVLALALRLDGNLLSSVGLIVPGLPIRAEFNDPAPSIISGSGFNRIWAGVAGATISGGGGASEGASNRVSDHFGTVGGGIANAAGDLGQSIDDAGGATVSGGLANIAGGPYSTVSGGNFNWATGSVSAIGGGENNNANGAFAAVPGGRSNRAHGAYSLAAGRRAGAVHLGAFVWADSADADFDSTGNNQFLIRASGGVGIGTPAPQSGLHLRGAGFPHSFAFLDGDGGNNDAGFRLLRQGSTKWHLFNSSSNDSFQIRPVDFGPLLVLAQNGRVGIGTATPQGRLDVNGPIYQRGGVLHADYVFEPGYPLESIEENARRMWLYGRLPAVPPRQVDEEGNEVLEMGAHRRGILEELEKAHVYIEQLDKRNRDQQLAIADLEARLAALEQRSSEMVPPSKPDK